MLLSLLALVFFWPLTLIYRVLGLDLGFQVIGLGFGLGSQVLVNISFTGR